MSIFLMLFFIENRHQPIKHKKTQYQIIKNSTFIFVFFDILIFEMKRQFNYLYF